MASNCLKRFTNELLWRSFSGQDIEAAHHHVDVAARQLLGSAQSFLRPIAFNADANKVGGHLDQL
jgi:hypothetical protein